MALNAPCLWLVAYDIADHKRLARVHRLLKQEGVPVQYSLFALRNTPQGVLRLKAKLADLIDHKADDVRIYRLPERPSYVALGATILPEDLLILGGPNGFAAKSDPRLRTRD
ncbi:MAG: CRISPR-associated endonuclease Cas2 [Gammaproteobacteria bacterium]